MPVTRTVTQYPSPVSNFGAVTGCQNAKSTFTDSSKIASGSIKAWNWSFGDGATSTLQNPGHTYSKSGPYKVKLVITSSFGCKDSIIKQIRIEPIPKAAFVYKNACIGTPIYFSNKSIDSTVGATYHWSFGDGTTSTSSSPAQTYSTNGTYAVVMIITSRFGCKDTTKQTLTPYVAPVVNFVYSGACTNNAVAFGDSDKNGTGATYTWNFGDGGSDVSNSDTATHIYTKAGANTVLLTIQSANGCKDTASKTINISDYPTASFTAPDVCEGSTTVFTNTSTGTGNTYRWYFNDTLSGSADTSSLLSPKHKFSKAGTYNVYMAATNSGGCTDTIMQMINVVALPVVGKWSYTVHNNVATFTPKDQSQKTYKWYFGTGDSSSSKVPVYTYTTKGRYYVKLVETNATGCSASYADSITITGLGVQTVTGPENDLDISIFPNPFEGKTSITYTLNSASRVNVSVYTLQGKLVTELKNGIFESGKYTDVFDAARYQTNEGVYMVKMTVNGEVFTGRIVEMR